MSTKYVTFALVFMTKAKNKKYATGLNIVHTNTLKTSF